MYSISAFNEDKKIKKMLNTKFETNLKKNILCFEYLF